MGTCGCSPIIKHHDDHPLPVSVANHLNMFELFLLSLRTGTSHGGSRTYRMVDTQSDFRYHDQYKCKQISCHKPDQLQTQRDPARARDRVMLVGIYPHYGALVRRPYPEQPRQPWAGSRCWFSITCTLPLLHFLAMLVVVVQ